MTKPTANYNEEAIKTLSPLEHIRLRSGMYIGRLGDGSNIDDGIYVLLKEIIDNAIDEYIMGNGRQVDIVIQDKKVSVRDYGRGIPLGKVIDCVSVINTGAKYNDEVFQFSVGLNGVGTKAVNALSSHFLVRSMRDGQYFEAVFSQGKLLKQNEGKSAEVNGVYVEFIPDEEIFGTYSFNFDFIKQRLFSYACLNKGLALIFNEEKFYSENGLYDFLVREVGSDVQYPIVYYRSVSLEFALSHTSEGYGESFFSFVNGQYTSDGGTHLSAFKEGLIKGVNDYYKSSFNSGDLREGMACAMAIKIKDPIFESQTKNKLGNNDIKGPLVAETKAAIEDFLHKNKATADKLREKILQNERLRKELNDVKKEARAAAKRVSLNIPKLKDCHHHIGDKLGEESSIFITEGNSAAGSLGKKRNPLTQAVYGLRGKPWNCYGYPQSSIYRNEELFNLMMALGIEGEVANLRYNKIIVATDADFDGYHIRNLLLTFFLSYFEELIITGKIFILETPLFRVTKGKEQIYCYNEKEKEAALKKVKNGVVTRFKGLGEISPDEFGPFIGSDMRLIPVTIESLKNTKEILNFYMGNNTPNRRDYIMANLIDDVG
ncbi:MAG: toprim domain-containing protein [Spirochaetaceae bacterium]|nr:toprim domain-containing protein [Spirochaetaceae bacterium]